MSEWDPWKRYEKERERRFWDPYYRYEYEQRKMMEDPFYRYERHLDRMSWDPAYRFEKEMNRLSWDPWYRELKRREWKYDEGALFRDRVLSDLGRGSNDVNDRASERKEDVPEWLEVARAKAYASLYSPSWWDYLKLGFSLFMLGGLLYWLLTFRLPLP